MILSPIITFTTFIAIAMLVIVVAAITYFTHLDSFRQSLKKGDIVRFKINKQTKQCKIVQIFETSVNVIEEGIMELHNVSINKLFPPNKND